MLLVWLRSQTSNLLPTLAAISTEGRLKERQIKRPQTIETHPLSVADESVNRLTNYHSGLFIGATVHDFVK